MSANAEKEFDRTLFAEETLEFFICIMNDLIHATTWNDDYTKTLLRLLIYTFDNPRSSETLFPKEGGTTITIGNRTFNCNYSIFKDTPKLFENIRCTIAKINAEVAVARSDEELKRVQTARDKSYAQLRAASADKEALLSQKK